MVPFYHISVSSGDTRHMRNGLLFASRLYQLTVSQVIRYRRPLTRLVLDLLIPLRTLCVSLDWAAYLSFGCWYGVVVEAMKCVCCSASRTVRPMPAFVDCWTFCLLSCVAAL
jgi:hypothetical protein